MHTLTFRRTHSDNHGVRLTLQFDEEGFLSFLLLQSERRTAVALVEPLGIVETVMMCATLLIDGNYTETLGMLRVVRKVCKLMIRLSAESDEHEGRSGRWWMETT